MTVANAARERDLRRVLVLLAVAISVIVATEFIVVGLLPVLARDLHITLIEAGGLVGAFALSAALLGPPLTLAVASQSPRRVLIATLLLFAAGNVVAVLASNYLVMMIVRVAQGAALPVFISAGTASVSVLASAERRGQTLARANIGFVIGLIGAVPAGVALAEIGRWSSPLLVLAALALAAAGALALWFPSIVMPRPLAAGVQSALLIQPLFLSHLLLSVSVFAAMFAAYTYLAVWLETVLGLGMQSIAIVLAGFGAAGLVGNAAAGLVADRAPLRATVLMMFLLVLAVIGASLLHERPVLLVLSLAVWGIAHTAGVTLSQVRVTTAGGPAPALAMALNISAANLGIALGAIAGGWVVARWGVQALGWGSGGLGVLVACVAVIAGWLERRSVGGSAQGDPHRQW